MPILENSQPIAPFINVFGYSKKTLNLDGLRDLEGNDVLLDDLLGRVTLIYVWSTWCIPCVSELPELLEFVDNHRETLNFIPISRDLHPNLMSFLKAKSLLGRYRWCLDDLEVHWNRLLATFVPATCFLNREGKLVFFNQNTIISHLLVGAQQWMSDTLYHEMISTIYEGRRG